MLSNNGQLDISCNVAFSVVHGDTGERETQYIHNRVTRTALMGIIHFIYGDFNVDNAVSHRKASSYTPKYLAIGGIPLDQYPSGAYAPSIGVGQKKLNHEFTTDEQGNPLERILISSRQITNPNTDYMTITFRIYIPSDVFQNVAILEAGLFTDIEGDNCWSKIALTRPIEKKQNDYVDVLWDVKISSVSAINAEEQDLTPHVIENEFNFTEGQSTPISYTVPLDEDFGSELPVGYTPVYTASIMKYDTKSNEWYPDTLDDYNLEVQCSPEGEITISPKPGQTVKLGTEPQIRIRYQTEWAEQGQTRTDKIVYKDYICACTVTPEEE